MAKDEACRLSAREMRDERDGIRDAGGVGVAVGEDESGSRELKWRDAKE